MSKSNSTDILRLMESSLSLKKGSLGQQSSFKPKVTSVSPIRIVDGQWEMNFEEGSKIIKISSFLNEQTSRYGLILEVMERDSIPKTLRYHRDFLSSSDAREEIVELRESALSRDGLHSVGYLSPKWRE
jgi:hypothetical protein